MPQQSEPASSAPASPSPSPGDPPRPAKILIADDDHVILALVEAILQSLHPEPEVRTAVNGSQAIEMVEEEAPDLVITDIRMPVVDGLQLLAHVVNERLATTVIAMTGFATAQLRDEVLREGAYQLLEKPLDPEDVLHAARQGLEKRWASEGSALSLPSLLELIELESKSCDVVVAGDGLSGYLAFQDGRLVHARAREREGDAAALGLLSLPWPTVDVLEAREAHPNTVTRNLGRLLEEATYDGYDVDPEIFETRELPQARRPSSGLDQRRFSELMDMAREFRGFCAASLIDLETCSVRFEASSVGMNARVALLPGPVCQLIQAEKSLIEGVPGTASHLLIRQPQHWHLIRELRGALALHIVFSSSANVALAQYQLAQRLIGYDLVDEPKSTSQATASHLDPDLVKA